MNKIKLAVTGCLGRMGQQIIKSSKLDKKFKLVALTENRKVNRKISGIKPELNDENAFKKANVIIDFTIPKCTFQVLKILGCRILRITLQLLAQILNTSYLTPISYDSSPQ